DDFAAFANDGSRVWLAAVQMPADAFRGERDGGKRVFDFVSYALRHFFPRQLTLGAQEFRRVFNDEDGTCPAVREFKACTGDGEVQVAAVEMEFNFGG